MARWAGPEGELAEVGGVLLWATASDFPVLLNGAARLDPAIPADQVLSTADRWFSAQGRGHTLAIGVGDADLVDAAEAAGMILTGDSPQMVCDALSAPPPVPADVELRWVETVEDAERFVDVVEPAYCSIGATPGAVATSLAAPERLLEPHLSVVLAMLEDAPAATAVLLESHGIAGVYYVGTIETARGRGLGELVTQSVTERALSRGIPVVGLQASQMGEPIYRRMGYREIGRTRSYVRFEPV